MQPRYGTWIRTTRLTVYRLSPRDGDLQRRVHELIVTAAELPASGRVLDVGCGSGSVVVKLAKASAGSRAAPRSSSPTAPSTR